MVAKISILVPAYNEASGIRETVEQLTEALLRLPGPTEILVIDDGSTDGTGRVAEEAGATVLRHETNRGYGAALKTGLRHAEGETIVIIDADLTYPSDRIPDLLEALEDCDMAVGSRTGDRVHIPQSRKLAKWVLRKLANRVAGREIPDLNSGLRAFRKDLGQKYFHLFPDGFSFTTTLTLASLCDGLRVRFIPIDYARREGKSKIRPVQDTFNFVVLILRIAAYFDPLRVFLPAAFFSGLVSVFLLVFYFIRDGGLSDSGVLACVVTLLVFMMGILADLVVRRSRS
jgi:glycosyltransferase involved in cell wall biosynthesis